MREVRGVGARGMSLMLEAAAVACAAFAWARNITTSGNIIDGMHVLVHDYSGVFYKLPIHIPACRRTTF
jgi:hypothetical protein